VVAVMRHAIDRSARPMAATSSTARDSATSATTGARRHAASALPSQALRIPLGEVLASPVFRARDTAEIAFGARARIEPMLTADDYTPDPAQLARQIAWLRARAAAPSAPAATDVLVGHIVPLGMMLGRSLAQAEYPEGAIAVFAPGGRLLGILSAESLAAAAGV
jgi:phosphohistidine phosphatase SixA